MSTISARKALVVLSGGQDSTTCLAMLHRLRQRGELDEIHAVTFNYGQRHVRELEAARAVGILLRVDSHEVVDIGPILKGTSPLLPGGEELETYSDFKAMDAIIGDRVEKTFVPMRNALFLTLAANRAVCLGAGLVSTGVCQADNANYPDCRWSFVLAQTHAINQALGLEFRDEGERIAIHAPLIQMSKAESIAWMSQHDYLGYLAFTHTAYDGQYPPLGNDHASLLRAEGFLQAGVPDPLILRAAMEGLIPSPPATPNYDEYAPALMKTLIADIERLGSHLGALEAE